MENIRVEDFLGSKKVIIGNKSTNLVLETLGKVYVKTGKQSRILTDLFKLLDNTSTKDVSSKTIIVGSVKEMEEMDYPGDGYFIFNTLDKSLYISYDDRYIMLVEAAQDTEDDIHVKKSGDSMTGQLEMLTDEAPLIVASRKLVENFNANYIEGYAAKDLAKKKVNEIIDGNWTFNGDNKATNHWTFRENIKLEKDLVIDGSVTTPMFASGFAGYGWRMDSETNTLTVDYLVVRKAMQVYEMVINKITATNGSWWVTNACKVETAYIPLLIDPYSSEYKLGYDQYDQEALTDLVQNETCYLFLISSNVIGNGYYKFIVHVKNAEVLASNAAYKRASKLTFEQLHTGGDSTGVIGFWALLNEDLLTREPTPSDFGSGVTEQDIYDFKENIKLYYIYDDGFVWNTEYTHIVDQKTYEETGGGLETFNVYDHYFAADEASGIKYKDNFYVVITENDTYPTLKSNDIIRCQKWDTGEIKYYDAVVTNYPADYIYVVQKAPSVFDKYTDIKYGDNGEVIIEDKYNDALYKQADYQDEGASQDDISLRLGHVAAGDSLVQVGSISNPQRQHAIYLTSTDDSAPYMTVISDLNRPDYSVLHKVPKYVKNGDVEVNYELVAQIGPDGLPVLDENGKPVMVRKYLWKYTDTCKVRIGNLNGIRDDRFPDNKQPYGFGFYGQNVFLTGEFYLNNGQSVVDFAADGIFLKYKRAGLELVDLWEVDEETGEPILDEFGNKIPIPLKDENDNPVYDENGKPIQKQTINLTADQINLTSTGSIVLNAEHTYIGTKESGSLFEVIDGKAYIKTDYIRAQTIEVEEVYNYSYDSSYTDEDLYHNAAFLQSTYNNFTDFPYQLADTTRWVRTRTYSGSYFDVTQTTESLISPIANIYPDEAIYLISPILNYDKDKLVQIDLEIWFKVYITADFASAFTVQLINIDTGDFYKMETYGGGSGRSIMLRLVNNAENKIPTGKYTVILRVSASGATEKVVYDIWQYNLSHRFYKGTLRWGLFKDGSGSLARDKISWTPSGELTINADFRATNGVTQVKLTADSYTAKVILSDADTVSNPITYAELKYTPKSSGVLASGALYLYSSYATDSSYYTTSLRSGTIRLAHKKADGGYIKDAYINYDTISLLTTSPQIGRDYGVNINDAAYVHTFQGGQVFALTRNGFRFYNTVEAKVSAWPNNKLDVAIGGVYERDGHLLVKLND